MLKKSIEHHWLTINRSSPESRIFFYLVKFLSLAKEFYESDVSSLVGRRTRRSRFGYSGRTYLAELRRRIEAAARGLAAARSLSEVKVRCVGTGCARIHFFGLTVCTFFQRRGISSHVYRPSLYGRRAISFRTNTYILRHTDDRVGHSLFLSLSLSSGTDPLASSLPLLLRAYTRIYVERIDASLLSRIPPSISSRRRRRATCTASTPVAWL